MPARKSAKKKHQYQILVTRYDTYRFDVEAESAEKACSTLHRRLRADEAVGEEFQQKPVFSTWSVPSQPQEQWIVMNTIPPEGTKSLLLCEWNGKNLAALATAKLGEDIIQAMRRMVDPRRSDSKLKKKA